MITETTFLGLPLRTPAQRRTLVVLYYALLVSMAAIGAHARNLPVALLAQTFIFGGLLGGIRPGGPVKAYAEPRLPLGGTEDTRPLVLGLTAATRLALGRREWSPLDERETHQRDRAHYQAYRLLRWCLGFGAAVYLLTWSYAPKRMEPEAPILLWFLLVFVLSLPQAVLLWTEPVTPAGELAEVSVA